MPGTQLVWDVEKEDPCFSVVNEAGRSILTHTKQGSARAPDDAVGSLVLTEGRHLFTISILASSGCNGTCLRVGVQAADGDGSWGLRPYDGRRHPPPPAREPPIKLMHGNLQGRCGGPFGAEVQVLVDMDRRRQNARTNMRIVCARACASHA